MVRNYGFHEKDQAPTQFKVEVEVAGEIRHFDGVISKNKETGSKSDVVVYEFDYDPDANQSEARDDYAQYDDEVILSQWSAVLPSEHILPIESPEAIVDVMLGALAIRHGSADLATYTDHMQQRGASPERVGEIERTLASLCPRAAAAAVEGNIPAGSASR